MNKNNFANSWGEMLNKAKKMKTEAPFNHTTGPQPVDWKKLSQPELAHMLKSFLIDAERHLPKIREIMLHLTCRNLLIVREQLAKNGAKYEKVITVLDAIYRTKHG